MSTITIPDPSELQAELQAELASTPFDVVWVELQARRNGMSWRIVAFSTSQEKVESSAATAELAVARFRTAIQARSLPA